MSAVLILTGPRDIHARAVAWALTRMDVPATLWLGSDFPTVADTTIEIACTAQRSALRLETRQYKRTTRDFSALWRRREVAPAFSDDLHHSDRLVATKECVAFKEGMHHILEAEIPFHANSYAGAACARSKVLQLHLARTVGFTIPDTLISNSAEEIRAFHARHGGNVIIKSFTSPTWTGEGKAYFPYASRLQPELLDQTQTLRACPAIYQGLVEKEFEVRALFVGAAYVAVRLESQHTDRSKYDWRAATSANVPARPIELPPAVVACCRDLMHRLGIVTGSFDFAVTPQNEYVFFEVNEQGQFLWMEERCPSLPVLQMFARFLATGSADYRHDSPADPELSLRAYLDSGSWKRTLDAERAEHVQVELHVPYPEQARVHEIPA